MSIEHASRTIPVPGNSEGGKHNLLAPPLESLPSMGDKIKSGANQRWTTLIRSALSLPHIASAVGFVDTRTIPASGSIGLRLGNDGHSLDLRVPQDMPPVDPPISELPTSDAEKPREEKYPEYSKRPAEGIYWSKVLLRFSEITDRHLVAPSPDERQQYVSELVYAYHIVEDHPDDLLTQQRELKKLGVANAGHLDQVTRMMPSLQEERESVFAETEELSYKVQKKQEKKARRRIGRTLGEASADLFLEKAEFPQKMVVNLAYFDEMINIFKDDAYTQYPHLQKNNEQTEYVAQRPGRKERNKIVSKHVNGLLHAHLAAEEGSTLSVLPDASDGIDYSARFDALQETLAEKKAEIDTAAQEWTPAQKRRHILNANRHFRPYNDTVSLEAETGLTEEMITDAKSQRRKEYRTSTKWLVGIEGGQMGAGWLLGGAISEAFDIKNLIAVGIIAGASRASTTALLINKQRLSKGVNEKTGVAPDPVTKLFAERLGKPGLGFGLTHWPFEAVYVASTLESMKVLGGVPGLINEIVADWSSIPRQIYENYKMQEVQGVSGIETKIVQGVRRIKEVPTKVKEVRSNIKEKSKVRKERRIERIAEKTSPVVIHLTPGEETIVSAKIDA